MHDPWIYSASSQPNAGEPIEFRLDEREQPICGTFADDAFHSRWADYGRSRVGSWRSVASDPAELPLEVSTPATSSFARILKRMKSMIPRSHRNELMEAPYQQATTAAIVATQSPMTPLPAANAVTNGIFSNQMSS